MICVEFYVGLECECFDEVLWMFVEGYYLCFGVCGVYFYCDVFNGLFCGCCGVWLIVLILGGIIFDIGDYSVLLEL